MTKVLLDTWTFEQYLVDESLISPHALRALEAAAEAKQLYVSVLSYALVRERALHDGVTRESLRDFDERMSEMQMLVVERAAVASMDKIPRVASLEQRLIAGIAMTENYTLLTETTEVCCPGLDFILSRIPNVSAL